MLTSLWSRELFESGLTPPKSFSHLLCGIGTSGDALVEHGCHSSDAAAATRAGSVGWRVLWGGSVLSACLFAGGGRSPLLADAGRGDAPLLCISCNFTATCGLVHISDEQVFELHQP